MRRTSAYSDRGYLDLPSIYYTYSPTKQSFEGNKNKSDSPPLNSPTLSGYYSTVTTPINSPKSPRSVSFEPIRRSIPSQSCQFPFEHDNLAIKEQRNNTLSNGRSTSMSTSTDYPYNFSLNKTNHAANHDIDKNQNLSPAESGTYEETEATNEIPIHVSNPLKQHNEDEETTFFETPSSNSTLRNRNHNRQKSSVFIQSARKEGEQLWERLSSLTERKKSVIEEEESKWFGGLVDTTGSQARLGIGELMVWLFAGVVGVGTGLWWLLWR